MPGTAITDSIRSIMDLMEGTNDSDDPAAKHTQYLKITPEQLSQLITACSSQVEQQLLTSSISPI